MVRPAWRLPRYLAFLGLLSACSGADVMNALAPTDQATIARDIAYGPDARRRLDVYAPSGRPDSRGAPVVVYLYGGGWWTGDRGDYRFVGASLAGQGLVTVIPDYRVYPEVLFPDFVRDAARAVAWTRAHIGSMGGDPERIFLMGHSSGAHIAMLLTLNREYLAAEGLDPDRDIAGTVGLAGPYDFLPLTNPVYQTIFAPAGDLQRTQPIAYARAGAPPLLLLTGRGDTTVLPRNTERLAARIRALGGRVTEKVYPGLGHAMIVGMLGRPFSGMAPVLTDIVAFFAANGPGPAASVATR